MPCKSLLLFGLKAGILLSLPVMLTGCLLDDEGGYTTVSHSNGVSLSSAMHASASGSTESLHSSGSSSSHTYYNPGSDSTAAVASGAGAASASAGSVGDFNLTIPLDVSYVVPFGGEFRSITRFTLTPISLEEDQATFGVYVGGDIVDLKPGSLPASAINKTRMYEVGLAGKYFLNQPHAFISPYISGSLGVQYLFWHYRNPVFIDGNEVNSDDLPAFNVYAGFGLAFQRNSHLYFFTEAGLGGTVFDAQTGQGFDNDVFHNFGYFSLKAGLCIKF